MDDLVVRVAVVNDRQHIGACWQIVCGEGCDTGYTRGDQCGSLTGPARSADRNRASWGNPVESGACDREGHVLTIGCGVSRRRDSEGDAALIDNLGQARRSDGREVAVARVASRDRVSPDCERRTRERRNAGGGVDYARTDGDAVVEEGDRAGCSHRDRCRERHIPTVG